MGLRAVILASPETMSDLAWAAEQRYQDGITLLGAGRHAGAVYVFGLASEMWLKLASGKLLGHGPAAAVAGLLGPVRTWMHLNGSTVLPESYHSLRFWAEHLVLRRTSMGLPLAGRLAGELRHHVSHRLFEDWKIELRYRQVALAPPDALRVYHDATWVRQTWGQLWR